MTSTPEFHQSGSLCFYVNQTCRFKKRLDRWFESSFLSLSLSFFLGLFLISCGFYSSSFFGWFLCPFGLWYYNLCNISNNSECNRIHSTCLLVGPLCLSHTTLTRSLCEKERERRPVSDWLNWFNSSVPTTSTKTDVSYFFFIHLLSYT